MTAEVILIIVSGIFSGTGIAALIGAISKKKQWERERKAQKEDKAEEDSTEWRKGVDEKLKAQGEGIKFLLYDKIQHRGQEYITAKEVTFDERKTLHKAHSVYHNGLHGNGDLDSLMRDVDELPLVAIRGVK